MEKLREFQDRYPNFEVDICLRPDGKMDVTHDVGVSFALPADSFFVYLSQHPGSRMWLDVKNLTVDNQALFLCVLDSMARSNNIAPSRLVVESPQWELLEPLTLLGYVTSYYIKMDVDEKYIHHLQRVADSGKVRALSFPHNWYRLIKEKLDRSEMMLLSWSSHRGQLRFFCSAKGRQMLNDPQLHILLIKDHGKYHR